MSRSPLDSELARDWWACRPGARCAPRRQGGLRVRRDGRRAWNQRPWRPAHRWTGRRQRPAGRNHPGLPRCTCASINGRPPAPDLRLVPPAKGVTTGTALRRSRRRRRRTGPRHATVPALCARARGHRRRSPLSIRPNVVRWTQGHCDGAHRDEQRAERGDPDARSPGRRPEGGIVLSRPPIGIQERRLVDQLVQLLGARPPQHAVASTSRIATIDASSAGRIQTGQRATAHAAPRLRAMIRRCPSTTP
jgi:hypothetical protein